MFHAIACLIGRVLLSAIFIISGISKIGAWSATVSMMEGHGIPYAPFLLFGATLLEIVGGLSVLTGYKARMGALLLAAFLIPTSYLMHFRMAVDASGNLVNQGEMINFMKNLSILGGVLMVYCNGAGKLSLGREN